MTETASGWIKYTGSSRDGSNWLAPATAHRPSSRPTRATLGPNAIYMPTLGRPRPQRPSDCCSLDGEDALSVQFAIDYGSDDYNLPTEYALQDRSSTCTPST